MSDLFTPEQLEWIAKINLDTQERLTFAHQYPVSQNAYYLGTISKLLELIGTADKEYRMSQERISQLINYVEWFKTDSPLTELLYEDDPLPEWFTDEIS